jgi:hypothetical protein
VNLGGGVAGPAFMGISLRRQCVFHEIQAQFGEMCLLLDGIHHEGVGALSGVSGDSGDSFFQFFGQFQGRSRHMIAFPILVSPK